MQLTDRHSCSSISNILMILRKFAMRIKDTEVGASFLDACAAEAISETFKINNSNLARELQKNSQNQDEIEEQLCLSVSCIYFLKICSTNF